MKKIFYILASAIVALGAVACENDGLDNIGLEVNGDTVSFIASIDNTRTDLNGLETVWDTDDTIQIEWNGTTYNFKNSEKEPNTFSCSADGLSAIVNAEITATYSHNNDGNIDSNAGTAGALLTYTGPFTDIKFTVENAFLKFAAEEGAEVTLTASAEIFRTKQLGLVKTVTLTVRDAEQYVAVLPKTTTITYAINGTDYGVSKENTLVAGKIYPLGELEVPGWKLVTDASTLVVGDQIVIAAATSNKALGTTQNNNNRAGVDATKTNNTIAVGADVQKIILEAGTIENTFAFKVGTQYLYAASSSANQLKSGTKNDNASWSISISNNVATVVAQGTYTRNTIYFNANNGTPIFSAYASKPTNGGEEITIYKYYSGKGTPIATQLATPTVDATARGNSINVSWDEVANASSYTVTCGETTKEGVTGISVTFEGLEYETKYNVSVVAVGDGTNYTNSEAGTASATTEADPNAGGGEVVEPEQPGGGEIALGAKYSYDVTAKVWSNWGTGAKCGNYTWIPNKVNVKGSPTVGNKDGSGRGQQFGAANTNQIITMTMTCKDYSGGVNSISVKACAKSGNTITVSVTVGGVEMQSAKSATISGSNSSSIATLNFTSDTVLTGDIVITYTLKTAGALYISGFGIN